MRKKTVTTLLGAMTALTVVLTNVGGGVVPTVQAQNEGEGVKAGDLKRVSVHDPSIFYDEATQNYYVYGSHMATAKSGDMMNWEALPTGYDAADQGTDPIYGDAKTNFAQPFKWAGYDDGDCAGGGYAVWAPEAVYNPNYVWEDGTKGAYMLYASMSSTWRRSCIGFLVSKNAEGPFTYVDTLVYSGFTNTGSVNYDGNSTRDTTYTNDYLNVKSLMDQGVIDSDVSTWKCFDNKGGWNHNYGPNAIDPTIFFEEDNTSKKMYMAYGSWSGGIYILELDPATGKAIYPGQDSKDDGSGNYVDRYFGTHISGGNHQSGEGPFIRYDKESGYYYYYETYGGLTAAGGYNMREFRSKDVFGPYMDAAGNNAANSGTDCGKFGIKLIGNYQFFDQTGYRAAGHNSVLFKGGDYYLVSHQRFDGNNPEGQAYGEYHEVRVRQQFRNADDWLVTAVYENKNEDIAHYDDGAVIGNYEFVNHGLGATDGKMAATEQVELKADGSVSGDETGTWTKTTSEQGYDYVTLNLGDVTYKGVFFQQANDMGKEVMTFTAVGNNNESIWGSMYDKSDKRDVDTAIKALKGQIPSTTRSDIALPKSSGAASITWSSDHKNVLDENGKVTIPKEDTSVTLTAVVKSGSASETVTFEVLVCGAPKMIVGYTFDHEKNPLQVESDASLKEDGTLMGDAEVVEDEERGMVLRVSSEKGDKYQNALRLPDTTFANVDTHGYTVGFWFKASEDTWEHSALFEAAMVKTNDPLAVDYPMTRLGVNMLGRINANGSYADSKVAPQAADTWNYATLVLAPNGLRTYVNGQLADFVEKDLTASLLGDADAYSIHKANLVTIGAGAIWGDEDVRDVRFDDVEVYDTAFTDEEVARAYKGQPVYVEPVKDDDTKDESAKDESAKDESAKDTPTKDDESTVVPKAPESQKTVETEKTPVVSDHVKVNESSVLADTKVQQEKKNSTVLPRTNAASNSKVTSPKTGDVESNALLLLVFACGALAVLNEIRLSKKRDQ